MTITQNHNEGHRQRLRRKFLSQGLAKFTEEEVLELLLTFGTPRRDCKQQARELLKRFGDLRSVLEAEPFQLAQIAGVGENNTIAIKFIHAAAGLYLEQRVTGRVYLGSSAEVLAYLRHHMENLAKEIFKVFYLNGAGLVLAVEDASQGLVGGAYVHTREIIERALLLQASGLVCVHNHPSGRVDPSREDLNLTRRLVHAASLVEMRILDHLIVGPAGDGGIFSFRDEGILSRLEDEIQMFYKMPPSKALSAALPVSSPEGPGAGRRRAALKTALK